MWLLIPFCHLLGEGGGSRNGIALLIHAAEFFGGQEEPEVREDPEVIPEDLESCGSISEAVIRQDSPSSVEDLLAGFWHARGNACRVKVSYQSRRRGSWKYGISLLGMLEDPQNVCV